MIEKLQIPDGLHAETWYQDEHKSVAFLTLSGLNKRIVNNRSHMTYEIVDGCGVFIIGDSCVRFVQAGEKVSIPAGTQYQDEGNLIMIATATPPFDQNDVVYIQQ